MQPTPRNKLYMTREDFPSYNDEIARVYRQLHPKEEDKEDDMLCQGRDLLRDRGVQPGLHLLLRVPQDQPPDELGNGKADCGRVVRWGVCGQHRPGHYPGFYWRRAAFGNRAHRQNGRIF